MIALLVGGKNGKRFGMKSNIVVNVVKMTNQNKEQIKNPSVLVWLRNDLRVTDQHSFISAFRLILKDPNVKAILINIFGGIVRCDRVAQGIVDAYKNLGDAIQVPIIVRLQGTNADIAKQLIDSSGLNVLSATAFQEAADKVQEAIA